MGRDWKSITDELNQYLRLRSLPVGIKVLANKGELDAIEKLRRPKTKLSPCQVVGQSIHTGFTLGATLEDIHGENCQCIWGLRPLNNYFHEGEFFVGVWFENSPAAKAHQAALYTVPHEKCEAFVVSPLRAGRIQPDVCFILANPGQAFMLLSGLVDTNYQKLECDIVGESSCSAGWIRTYVTGKPGMVLPCFAEMRYGGYPDGEVVVTMLPAQLEKALQGLKRLSSAGLRYPVPSYANQTDPRPGMGVSYDY